jgi:hypothetical protein
LTVGLNCVGAVELGQLFVADRSIAAVAHAKGDAGRAKDHKMFEIS